MTDSQDDPEEMKKKKQEHDANVVKFLAYMFHKQFCPAEEIPDKAKLEVLPVYFCGWLDKNMTLMNVETECEAAGVEHETWEFVRRLLDGGAAPESIGGAWLAIVLDDRPDPKSRITSVNTIVNITYSDGTISTSQSLMHKDMLSGVLITDSILGTMLQNSLKQIVTAITREGVDALHAEGMKQNVFVSTEPEDPFNVMMGMMLKMLIPQLKPALQRPVENYVRLAQQCIRPVVPAHILAGFKQRQAAEEAKEKGIVRGGWDAP